MEKLIIYLNNISDGFNWVRTEGNEVFASTGEKFSLSFEIEKSPTNRLSVQVQAAMVIADRAVWRWGCENESNTHLVLSTFTTIKNKAQLFEMNEQETLGTELRAKIDAGTKTK